VTRRIFAVLGLGLLLVALAGLLSAVPAGADDTSGGLTISVTVPPGARAASGANASGGNASGGGAPASSSADAVTSPSISAPSSASPRLSVHTGHPGGLTSGVVSLIVTSGILLVVASVGIISHVWRSR
jgi:hypothetical protein